MCIRDSAKMVGGIAICWQYFGYNIIFLSAGLNAISQDVYLSLIHI